MEKKKPNMTKREDMSVCVILEKKRKNNVKKWLKNKISRGTLVKERKTRK